MMSHNPTHFLTHPHHLLLGPSQPQAASVKPLPLGLHSLQPILQAGSKAGS
jgi:hypothetical protein